MSAAKLAPPAAPGQIRRGTLRCAALAIAVAAWCAATVIVCGAQAPLRAFLDFGFGGVAHTPAQAIAIAAHNATFVAAPLIAAAVIRPLRAVRIAVEIILAALLITNSALVGLALGAYGTQLASAVVIHLPLEFAAFCLAGGTYIAATDQPLRSQTLLASTAACGALIAAAAIAETYLPAGTL